MFLKKSNKKGAVKKWQSFFHSPFEMPEIQERLLLQKK